MGLTMDEKLQPIVDAFEKRFDARMSSFRGQTRLFVAREHLPAAATALRDEFGFEMLTDLTAVDYWPQESPRFHVVYWFTSWQHQGLRISLRIPLEGEDAVLPTLEGVYPNANWYERELWDMFGIRIEGHSDLRRILMPYDWVGHPLRKDYPLGYEEVQFSFNQEEIMVRKAHPQD